MKFLDLLLRTYEVIYIRVKLVNFNWSLSTRSVLLYLFFRNSKVDKARSHVVVLSPIKDLKANFYISGYSVSKPEGN